MDDFGDDDFDLTRTVTICLDSEDAKDNGLAQVNSLFDDIQTPSTSDYVLLVNPKIKISQIPQSIVKVLQLRLNTPEIGSMKNWEYLAALMGMSLDEITILRRASNPMERLLDSFGDTYFNQLLSTIASVNRIDVLISLRPHLKHIDANLVNRQRPAVPSASFQSQLHISPNPTPLKPLPPKFILVTHHEPPRLARENQQMMETTDSAISLSVNSSSELDESQRIARMRKKFKHLWKNLETWSEKASIPVFDINTCIEENNAMQSLNNFFNQATLIVLVASESYEQEICRSRAPSTNPKVDIKRTLEQNMQMEYIKYGRQNERFCVIVTDANDKKFLPMGWATSTIVYTFPENHAEIVKKLFESNK